MRESDVTQDSELSLVKSIDQTHALVVESQLNAELGEGPLWVAEQQSLYWVDILRKHVHCFDVINRTNKTWTFETEVTALAQREQGGFIATIRDGFAAIDFNTCTIKAIDLVESDKPGNRFNDGKIDHHGNFWAGSMDDGLTATTGALYKLSPDHQVAKMDHDYIITNGPAFSPDGHTMYHNDTGLGVIYAFDVDHQDNISNKRIFASLDMGKDGSTDGITVDSEGGIWLAHFGGARVTRYSVSGSIDRVIELPCPNITSCTFGGQNLDTLYITTARCGMTPEQLKAFPLAGSLFSCKPGFTGLQTQKFKG